VHAHDVLSPAPKLPPPKVERTCMSKHTLSPPVKVNQRRSVKNILRYPPMQLSSLAFTVGDARPAREDRGSAASGQGAHMALDRCRPLALHDGTGQAGAPATRPGVFLSSPLKDGRGTYPSPCSRTRSPDVRCAQPATSRAAFASLVDGT
jgi:hypothetical protein